MQDLIQSLDYIEKVRAYGYNKGGRRRLSQEKCADLYYAGYALIDRIRAEGTPDDIRRLDQLIARYEKEFN